MFTPSLSDGEDYRGGPFSLYFPPEENTISFNVTIIDDNVIEFREDFSLVLGIPDTAAAIGVVLGSPDTASVNIVDDDSEYVCTNLQHSFI